MTSHLRVTIDDIDLVLTEDTSLSVEMKNPYLNDGIDTYTYQFDVPLDGNRELLGDIDNPDSDRRLTSIEGHPMAIYVDGVLLAHGKVATIDEQTIIDRVSISMTSNKKQLKDLIGELRLRDLTFPDEDKKDLQIGEKIGNIQATSSSTSSYKTVAHLRGYGMGMYLITLSTEAENIHSSANGYVQPQALGFSAPKEYSIVGGEPVVRKDFINTSEPYNNTTAQPDGTTRRWLYHNARICYLHHAIDGEGKSLDTVQIDRDKYGPYYLLEADRPQSGICFYVMYIINVLFKQLQMIYDEKPVYDVEDMRHLSFFTTLCKYDIDTAEDAVRHFSASSDFSEANQWLEERNIKGKLSQGFERNKSSEDEADTFKFVFYEDIYINHKPYESNNWILVGRFGASGGQATQEGPLYADSSKAKERVVTEGEDYHINVHFDDGTVMDTKFECYKMEVESDNDSYQYMADVVRMYANADNLPDMSVSSFIESLWTTFGLRFHYDSESNVVTPYFIRDVLRNTVVHNIYGRDISVHKIAEKITGVRMKYSAESDRKEQLAYIRKGVTDYDTRYDYLVDKTPPADIITSRRYTEVAHGTMSVNDMNLYIDTVTGNAYRIKINKDELDAGNIAALQPALFQVAQFKGILEMDDDHRYLTDSELMDPDVADYIQEISSDFEPLVQNDLYARKAKNTQLLAPFTDEEMWNESAVMGAIRNPVDSNAAYVHYVQEDIEEEERYDVGTDDGNSPLQHIDWGASICIMRGGGTDATIHHYDRGYDFFNNEKWRMVSGDYCMDYDTITNYAEQYDYNGNIAGVGTEKGRFSLAIRAYHKHPETGEILCSPEFAQRGLADTFFAEYIYFLLHRKKLAIKTLCEIEHIIDMQWRDKYAIAGHTGWIDQVSVKISVQKGIEDVEFTMFEL